MIGTSLGQQFDDKMSMYLGLDNNVIKPADTGDNNEITPMDLDQNQKNRLQDETDPNLGGVDV
jgi:hypothetical protein